MALAFVQAFGLAADMVMVTLDFKDIFTLKASLHPVIYAVKLKIEFLVLNLLGAVVGSRGVGIVEWIEGRVDCGERGDVKRPSVIGKDGGFGENGAGGCLRCHVLGKRESGRTERSMAMSEGLLAPLSKQD